MQKTIQLEIPKSGVLQKVKKNLWKWANFEFMDLNFLPKSLRNVLRDILECGNSAPFRSYFNWVGQETSEFAKNTGCDNIVELGAGTAPMSRLMFGQDKEKAFSYCPTDINPDLALYTHLAKQSKGSICPKSTPVDFSKKMQWSQKDLLLLSATFHHIPEDQKNKVLKNLLESGAGAVVIAEPLNNNVQSLLLTFASIIAAVLVPLRYLSRPGTIRRVVWCWFIPVAPLVFVWDGLISALRCWRSEEWQARGSGHSKVHVFVTKKTLFCTLLKWQMKKPALTQVKHLKLLKKQALEFSKVS